MLQSHRVKKDQSGQLAAHDRLSESMASGAGIPGVVATLAELTERGVRVELGDSAPALLGLLRRGRGPARDGDCLVTPILVGGSPAGFICLSDPERSAGRLEIFALEEAARLLAVALEPHRHQRAVSSGKICAHGHFAPIGADG